MTKPVRSTDGNEAWRRRRQATIAAQARAPQARVLYDICVEQGLHGVRLAAAAGTFRAITSVDRVLDSMAHAPNASIQYRSGDPWFIVHPVRSKSEASSREEDDRPEWLSPKKKSTERERERARR